eukprot:6899948-Alexandrium_andersonii.AAC.1
MQKKLQYHLDDEAAWDMMMENGSMSEAGVALRDKTAQTQLQAVFGIKNRCLRRSVPSGL